MPAQSHVTLELRTARSSETGPDAAAQLFATLSNPPDNPLLFWKQGESVVFEYASIGQTIYAFATIPEYLEKYLSSQLTANYPEILIKKLEHNPLAPFSKTSPYAVGTLKLSAPSIYPLKTFKESGTTDPLASVLSVLSKFHDDERALVQFHIRKARDGWKRAGWAQPTPDQPPKPYQQLVQHKVEQPGFQIEMRIIVASPTQKHANALLRSLTEAFGGYESPANHLKLEVPLVQKSKLFNEIISRKESYSLLRPTYVSLEELATLFHLPSKQLSIINNIAWGKTLLGEPPENLPTFTHTPDDQKDGLNLFGKTVYKNTEQIFGIKKDDRRRHMYVLGKSGTGKSTLLANMIINDLKHNEGIAVIDPHGDLIDTVLNYIPKHRINDVIVFDPADPQAVVKLNLFEGGSVIHRELIASGIVAIFHKLYSESWGPRLEYILRNSLLTLLERRSKLDDVLRLLTDKKYREKIVEELEDPILKNFWEAEFNVMTERLRQESISPILNKVGQFVTSPLVRNVVNNTTSSFSIEDVMNQGKILLVDVSQGKLGENNAALLGAMVITQIQLAAMGRVYQAEEDRKDFFLYIDEFQNFATTSFVKILSEARKYRLSLTLSNQYIAQIPEEVQSAIFGNAGTITSFLMGADDASRMQREFENLYSVEDLVSLGRYQTVLKLLIDGRASRPFPATTLPLASSANQNREKVLRTSRERYARAI
ncbi:MAG TPA: type IV secretory system conjugative DNA transfer family protein [Patescibacteria group bacterium]|nr:type IV secretory system conjugative DNA transfer family protein [Patescibacteria group bacterium]